MSFWQRCLAHTQLTPSDACPRCAQSPEALAESYKARGNDAFGRGKFLEAEELYSSAVEVGHALPQRAVYLANRAAARLHLGRYADAAEDCTAALEVDAVYVKVPVPGTGGIPTARADTSPRLPVYRGNAGADASRGGIREDGGPGAPGVSPGRPAPGA